MNFEVRLTNQIAVWAMRAAGLDPVNYQQIFFDVLDRKVKLPADVFCPYFPSDEPVNVRVTVDSFGSPTACVKIEVEDEAIGNRIQEKLAHYSEENRGLSVLKRERENLQGRLNEILKRDGLTLNDIQAQKAVMSKATLESLMQFYAETEPAFRHDAGWVFRKEVIAKADRPFVARWLVGLFPAEKDPAVWYDTAGLLFNGLAVAEIADDLIGLIRNRRYGACRGGLCDALVQTKDSRAAEVIASVLDEEGVTVCALECLGKLKAVNYVEPVRKYLRHPDANVRREAKRTLLKLGFPVETPPPPVHLVKAPDSVPNGLEEWSANLDPEDLQPALEKLTACLEGGFGRKEIAEIEGVADAMKPEQTRAFRFPVRALGEPGELWVVVFMDDIDSPDLYIYARPEVIRKFGASVELKG